MINRKDSPIKLTPPISGTFWLHMEAFPACPQEGNGLNKNSLIWKTEIRKKKKATEKIMYSSAIEGDISLLWFFQEQIFYRYLCMYIISFIFHNL